MALLCSRYRYCERFNCSLKYHYQWNGCDARIAFRETEITRGWFAPSTVSLHTVEILLNTAFTSPASLSFVLSMSRRWVKSSWMIWYLVPATTSTPATYHVTGTFFTLNSHSNVTFLSSTTVLSSNFLVNSFWTQRVYECLSHLFLSTAHRSTVV